MSRKIVVTSALPYANGPIHIGHLVEYLQTDIWVRFQKACGNRCLYFCADDTHGTPVMIRARADGIEPQELIQRVHAEHIRDFTRFNIEFDNYYSTHSEENRQFSELLYKRALENGSITKRDVEQAYCAQCDMWLPDRYIRGICPRCKAPEQYGDSCDACGGTHRPTELIDPVCANCGAEPVRRTSTHYFFKLGDYTDRLRKLFESGHTQKSVQNKLDEWFKAGLRDWDISRDGPYFGFKIPGEQNKFFYVWLDAPIGYIASCKNYCDRNGLDFDKVWNSDEYELYHFIGKDIMYFHALFWPAMLMSAKFKTADKLFVHGFLTVNGQKMSKSKGTFIRAETYLNHLDPQYLRYYYATKLTSGIEDIDLNFDDFVTKINSDLVGKIANLASRSVPMLTKNLDGTLGRLDRKGAKLVRILQGAKGSIIADFDQLNYAAAMRTVSALADESNRYFDREQPWETIKTDPEKTRATLTAAVNAAKILTIYLKPVLPKYAQTVERFLKINPLGYADVDNVLEEHKIDPFERLVERVETEKVQAMIDQSREPVAPSARHGGQSPDEATEQQAVANEPIEPECSIEDFMKIDLRIAKVDSAEPVEGADKLLRLELDLGSVKKVVLAGIAKAYKPADLVGKKVVCVANLKPRKMKFGVSEGMILAAGPGGKDIFMLTADDGAEPGQRVH
ncbi:MAG TPA: methionine--tRNA ligase [Planctomycetes bacterium]|nr:methionine--tRNA ligase [Planctomycetota bacterium]HIJ72089.1 methionine--tRNA ligase [Planctomycetota bacterium]